MCANGLHRLRSANELTAFTTPVAPIDPIFDLAGNMTTIPSPKDPTKKLDLKFDAWNRMVEAKNDAGVVVQTSEYNGLNHRIVKIAGADTFDYYYNQQWQVLEIRKNGSANPLAQYVYHPEYVDSIALRYYDADTDGTGIVKHYYLQDANFNVTAITDSAGTVVERYSYAPYGEATVLDINFLPVAGNTSTIENELRFTGRRTDPETGLQLNRNRFYLQQLGRWVNRDPVGYAGYTFNLYEYARNSPVVGRDPSGLKTAEQCAESNLACIRDADDAYKRCTDNGWSSFFCDIEYAARITGCAASYAACLATSEEAVTCFVVGTAVGLCCADGPLPVGDAAAAGLCCLYFGPDDGGD